MNLRFASLLACVLALSSAFSQTIAEKISAGSAKGSSNEQNMDSLLREVNTRLVSLRDELDLSYAQVASLDAAKAPEGEYYGLLQRVNAIKEEMHRVENEWRMAVVDEAKRDEEG